MHLAVFWFGHPARSPFESEVEEYRRRVARRWPAEDQPLRPYSRGRKEDAARARRQEAAKVRGRHTKGWVLVTLDERGRSPDSSAFARFLGGHETEGRAGVSFVIGSDLGLDRSLVEEADTVFSLGPMTFPHQIARLLLWEQLFRATDILGSGRYHRGESE